MKRKPFRVVLVGKQQNPTIKGPVPVVCSFDDDSAKSECELLNKVYEQGIRVALKTITNRKLWAVWMPARKGYPKTDACFLAAFTSSNDRGLFVRAYENYWGKYGKVQLLLRTQPVLTRGLQP